MLRCALAAGTMLLCGAGAFASQSDLATAQSQQWSRGEDIYFASCAECHNADLSGGASHSAPALTGNEFRARWAAHTAYDLLDRTRSTMPQEQPKSLTDQAYLDVVAFLLKRNDIALGDGVFTEQTAKGISLR